MHEQQRIKLYTSTILKEGSFRLSPAYAEIFERSPLRTIHASFERDAERPDLVRVTRLRDTVRL
jgi:hypothetical protein